MSFRIHLLFALCLIPITVYVEANRAGGPRLTFCDYILQIGASDSQHCPPPKGMGRSMKMKMKDRETEQTEASKDGEINMEETIKDSTPTGYKSCFLKFNPNNCLRSKYCASNMLCVDVVGNPCCVTKGVCPTKQQLDVKCVKSKATNWCNADYDCGRGSLCCDTGCGLVLLTQ